MYVFIPLTSLSVLWWFTILLCNKIVCLHLKAALAADTTPIGVTHTPHPSPLQKRDSEICGETITLRTMSPSLFRGCVDSLMSHSEHENRKKFFLWDRAYSLRRNCCLWKMFSDKESMHCWSCLTSYALNQHVGISKNPHTVHEEYGGLPL